MPLLLILAGVILLVAGPWFTGQAAVGVVLIVAGVVIFALALMAAAGASRAIKHHRRFFE